MIKTLLKGMKRFKILKTKVSRKLNFSLISFFLTMFLYSLFIFLRFFNKKNQGILEIIQDTINHL